MYVLYIILSVKVIINNVIYFSKHFLIKGFSKLLDDCEKNLFWVFFLL